MNALKNKDARLSYNLALALGHNRKDTMYVVRPFRVHVEVYDRTLARPKWRKFDYKDLEIFKAICKHWNLSVGYVTNPLNGKLQEVYYYKNKSLWRIPGNTPAEIIANAVINIVADKN